LSWPLLCFIQHIAIELHHIRCTALVASSIVNVPLLLGSCSHSLEIIIYQPLTLLTIVKRLSHNSGWSILQSVSTNLIYSTASNSSSVVWWCCYWLEQHKRQCSSVAWAFIVMLMSCYLCLNTLTVSFWLNWSGFQLPCHNI
jgi:hypothetical protein